MRARIHYIYCLLIILKMPELNSQVVAGMWATRYVVCGDLAGATLLIFDYFLTLRMEISYIWKSQSRLSLLDILYLVTRYLPIANLVLTYKYDIAFTSPTTDSHSCPVIFAANGWLSLVGVALAEIVLSLRTWALWGKDRRVLYTLSASFIISWIVSFVILGRFLVTLSRYPICGQISGGHSSFIVVFTMIFALEAVILGLTVLHALRNRKMCWSSTQKVIYRDGIMYCTFLLAISIINIFLLATKSSYANLLFNTERMTHSIFVGRIILHIREEMSTERDQYYIN
ncbi:hypothetical protein BDQ17DRAFT_1363170 [Cyathus striatus]|nr:hypothetical protein BDQ17DRAFT_1363170 [Cyathus striatus]